MKKNILLFLLLVLMIPAIAQKNVNLTSPNGQLKFILKLTSEKPMYDIVYKNKALIKDSPLGFDFDSGEFGKNLKIGKTVFNKKDETYELVIGKVKEARDHHNEVIIPLEEVSPKHRKINLIVRAFNDGVAFRFEFPKQDNWDSYVMYDEKTEFNINGDPKVLALFVPNYINTHEGLYTYEKYSDLPEEKLIDMPTTFEYPNEVFMSIMEAAILDYAGLYLSKKDGRFVGRLSPHLGQEKVKVKIDGFPHRTPWRVFSISDKVGTLIESNILTNLNEPCKIENISWIEPCKTTFTWWNGNVVPDTTFSPGNNFMTNKYYIDFAARNGIDLHNIYGYAETPWYIDDNFNFGWAGPNADATKPVPCLELPRISEYAKSKGVGLHIWIHWRPLYAKLEEAFSLYQKWGIKGMMVDFLDRDDQEMIKVQEDILQMAAKYQLFIQFHGASKPSGLHRTYPNEFTREGTLNYEVCKWDTIVNADHDINMPFSRMLAGPADYHLGGFRAQMRDDFKIQYINPFVMSTRCHMLAMYVVLENYLTSLCDTPQAYEGQPGFEFLLKVPSNWDDIKVPHAKIKEYVTIARKKGDDWFVGSINNSTARDLSLKLDFLDDGNYLAEMYTDSPETVKDPNKLLKQTIEVTKNDVIDLPLAADGGAVVHLMRISN